LLVQAFVTDKLSLFILGSILLVLTSLVVSLAASFYIYDRSGLYKLDWLDFLKASPNALLVNIHAGFDETSFLLANKYPSARLKVLDFYNPVHHTEVSIKRARKAYPPYPGTQSISTSDLSLEPGSVDYAFCLLSAHEIRNRNERTLFFKAMHRSLKEEGNVIVVEHLRNLPNFMAYNIGFLHFFSKREWTSIFATAGLFIDKEIWITPFIRAFILQRNGTTS
jgi:SAM-dependent methyltransferase